MSELTTHQRVLFDLVNTPSVSGDERAAVGVFCEHATRLGLRASVDGAGNGLAERGNQQAGVHIVLLGHIDTVPGEIPVRVEAGVLHGRGSVDAKGPLAAFLVAASKATIADGVRLSVVAGVGEETPTSPGANYLKDRLSPDACLIGEPSSWDGVTLGYKGRLLATARVRLDNAHTSGPDLSAADELFAWWSRVLAVVEGLNLEHDRVFEQVQATIQEMETSNNGLEEVGALRVGFRLPTRVGPDEIESVLRGAVGESGVTIECEGREIAHATDRSDPVVRALSVGIRAVGGRARPKVKTGTADLNVVGPVWRCPIAAYGPGDSSLDHTPHERLELAEFDRSVAVLVETLGVLSRELVGLR